MWNKGWRVYIGRGKREKSYVCMNQRVENLCSAINPLTKAHLLVKGLILLDHIYKHIALCTYKKWNFDNIVGLKNCFLSMFHNPDRFCFIYSLRHLMALLLVFVSYYVAFACFLHVIAVDECYTIYFCFNCIMYIYELKAINHKSEKNHYFVKYYRLVEIGLLDKIMKCWNVEIGLFTSFISIVWLY